MPIDYSKAKIYKLTTIHNPDLVYYGSTVNPLYKRKGLHKGLFKSNKLTCSSYKLFELGIDDVEITLVEYVNCNNKEELLKRERFYIENNNCINKNIPSRTGKQFYKEKKEFYKEYYKNYYQKNKDTIKDNHKQNYEENKDKFKEKNKLNYEKNKLKKTVLNN